MLQLKTFTIDELSARQFHEIIALRESIFIVEQNCAYQDADTLDIDALHVCGTVDNQIVSYVRILPIQTQYIDAVAIGRVVTHKDYRGQGFSSQLIRSSIHYCHTTFIGLPIRISAQAHLQHYYERFGFVVFGHEYLEDNIPHVSMQLLSI